MASLNKAYEERRRRSTWLKCPMCGPSESNLSHGSCACGHKFHPYAILEVEMRNKHNGGIKTQEYWAQKYWGPDRANQCNK
jgi:hypothetical protein